MRCGKVRLCGDFDTIGCLLGHLVVGRLCVLALDARLAQGSGRFSSGILSSRIPGGGFECNGFVDQLWAASLLVLNIAARVVLPYGDTPLAGS